MGRGRITESIRMIMEEHGVKTTDVQRGQKKRTFYWFKFISNKGTGEVRVYGEGFILFMLSTPEGRRSEVTRSVKEAIDFVSETIK